MKRSKVNTYDYVAAMNVARESNYLFTNESREAIGVGDEDNVFFIMPEDQRTAEDLLIKKENYENLSDDAREVIQIILGMRADTKIKRRKKTYKVVTKRRLIRMLNKRFKSKKRAAEVIEELTEWAASL